MAVVTPPFRVSFPNVFRPKKNDLNGQDEYSIVALFEKGADLTVLKEAAAKVLVEKFGPDKSKWPTTFRSPFRDQGERKKDGKLPDGLVEGAIFMNFKSKQKPALVDGDRSDIIDSSQFYAGCWARAHVNPYWYDQKGNKGIAFGLNGIQKVRDDTPLAGRPAPSDMFEAIKTPNGQAAVGGSVDASSLFN